MAEEHLKKINIEDWITKSRKLKWTWAGHVARRTDGRWSTAGTHWESKEGGRHVGHPKARWRDDLDNFVKEYMDMQKFDWFIMAQDREAWAELEVEFATHLQR